jgi:asparagine synthase (glutamine-hydrolysing)
MCGIAGLFRSHPGTLEAQGLTGIVERMISTMPHRGPDARGTWSDPVGRCVLGHLRLSIIDTSAAGLQPMATGDGRWLISFNGELYNFQELRPALAAAGITLRGRTDTEVVIESIALWGADALPKFDGMFALAAFDTLSGELFLARDPFGEKPLYYMQSKNGLFAFASELQALEKVPGFDGTVSVDAMAEVLTFQYIGAPRSIYQHVKKLPPAHWLRVSADGQITTGRYFQFRPGESATSDRPFGDLADELEEILAKSLQRRLIADVPLGAFLSGGVDSSTICALVRRKLNRPLKSFSTGFEGAPETEHLVARSFAQHLGTDHHEQLLNPNASEFLLSCGALLDEPNGDSSCLPTYLLSRFAREQVTVAVSGDGGDEMFGGYGRYFHLLGERDRHRAGKLRGWRPGDVYFGSQILVAREAQITELFGFVPAAFADHLARMRAGLNDAPDDRLLAAMRRSDVDNYLPGAVLPKVDRMSMRHSLEVRTPFLNVEVARFAERLPETFMVHGTRGKRLLREVAYRYLPRELVDLPKQGFAMPMSDWAKTSLLEVASKLIEHDDSRLRSALGPDAIRRFMARQRTPGSFFTYQVWAVVALESWLRHHPAVIPSIAEPRANQRR